MNVITSGRTRFLTTPFMGAMVNKRHNLALKIFCDPLFVARKPKLVAQIAAARKLITRLKAILRDGTPWQPA